MSDLDPFTSSDPFSQLGRLPGLDGNNSRRSRRAEYRRPLLPGHSDSLTRHVLDSGVSGLSYVLGTLDKPGQAVRGVLAGHGAAALKHLMPFSDSLGLTAEKDHVTGRDLTDRWGITSRGDKGWGAWGAGLAADIATDPLTFAGAVGPKAALNRTGQALEKVGALKGWTRQQLMAGFHATEPELMAAGKTASDIAHLADQGKKIATQPMVDAVARSGGTVQAGQPLSGLVRIGIPLGPQATFGTGRVAQKVAAGLDKVADFTQFGNPVGRAVGALFDSTRHGAVDEVTQRGAVKYMEPALQALKQQARDDSYRVIAGLDPVIKAGAHSEAAVTEAARAAAEGVPFLHDPALVDRVRPVADDVNSINARHLAEARRAGAPIADVADPYVSYVHRQALDVNHKNLQLGGKKGNFFPVVSGSNVARDELFRGIPGGTSRINDWFRRFAANKDQAQVARAVKKDMVADLLAGGGAINRAVGKEFDAKAAALAERLAGASERYSAEKLPLFTPDLAADVTQRGAQHARTVAAAKTAIGTLGDVARRITPGSDMIPLTDVLKTLGLKTYKADKAAGTPMEGALVEMYRALAGQGAGKVDPFLIGKMKALRGRVAQYGITPEHFGQVTKAYQKWLTPEPLKSPLGALDSFTNAFKALAYPIWIPAHVRNAATAGVNNARRGVGLGDYLDQLAVMTGRGGRDLSSVHPSLAALTPTQQIEQVRRMQFASANIFGGHGLSDDIADSALDALHTGNGRFTPHTPGSDRVGPTGSLIGDTAHLIGKEGLLGTLQALGQAVRHPTRAGQVLGIKGVAGSAKDALPAVRAGRTAGTNIEDFFRGAQWFREVRQGSTPEVAAEQINKLHFDYDALTDFEKNVMRRLVPFYTFARRNLPLQLETLAAHPGLVNAQYKPFNQPEPGGKGYVPRYLASGVAIPTGPEKDGKRQYVSKLGLPAEEAFERLHFRNGLPDVRATALDYMGQLNPILKAPLEQIFDTQFHTQRRLSDLKAPQAATAIGRLFGDDNPQLLAQIMANSPFTRFVTSADKILDDRKGWPAKLANLLTGVRVTDVDADKQRAVELRDALDTIMRGHPHLSRYSSFYVKPEDAASLAPEETQLMRLYTELQDRAKAYAKDKRRRIGVRP